LRKDVFRRKNMNIEKNKESAEMHGRDRRFATSYYDDVKKGGGTQIGMPKGSV